MKHFAGKEIAAFLKAVDRHLNQPFRLELIGAAVALLSFKSRSGTLDIDCTHDIRKIAGACDAARAETGLDIPVQTVSIFDGPYHYESRLHRLPSPKLGKLQVHIPEKHDWALMKIVRLYQKDIEDIREVAGSVGLNRKILLARFLEEMIHVIGRRRDLIFNFVTMMEQLYGKADADRMEAAIRGHKSWKQAF